MLKEVGAARFQADHTARDVDLGRMLGGGSGVGGFDGGSLAVDDAALYRLRHDKLGAGTAFGVVWQALLCRSGLQGVLEQ